MILLRPVDKKFPISQKFGENPKDYPLTHGHNGIDIGVPEGTSVRAAANGIVLLAALDVETAANPKKGYGFHVRIQHPDGSMTIYGHFREGGLQVQKDQNVRMGDFIGLSGTTGNSTAPHLHFELRLGAPVTSGVDPLLLIVDETPPDAGLFGVAITPAGNGLRIRIGPGVTHPVLNSLKAGDRVKVFNLAGTDAWLKVEDGFIKFDPTFFTFKSPVDTGLFSVVIASEGNGLRVRGGPGTSSPIIRSLATGDRLKVLDVVGTDVWLRLEEGFIKFEPEFFTIETSVTPPAAS